MRFKLIVRPDGRALLTTTDKMNLDALRSIRAHVEEWDAGRFGVAVIPECDVIQVSDITLDLGDPAPHRSEGRG